MDSKPTRETFLANSKLWAISDIAQRMAVHDTFDEAKQSALKSMREMWENVEAGSCDCEYCSELKEQDYFGLTPEEVVASGGREVTTALVDDVREALRQANTAGGGLTGSIEGTRFVKWYYNPFSGVMLLIHKDIENVTEDDVDLGELPGDAFNVSVSADTLADSQTALNMN